MGVRVGNAKNQEMSFRYWEFLLECVVDLLLRDDDVVLLVVEVEQRTRKPENESKSSKDDFFHVRFFVMRKRTRGKSPNVLVMATPLARASVDRGVDVGVSGKHGEQRG